MLRPSEILRYAAKDKTYHESKDFTIIPIILSWTGFFSSAYIRNAYMIEEAIFNDNNTCSHNDRTTVNCLIFSLPNVY
jgi:hypothetical protein